MTTSLDVIVVNWNGGDLLRRCLASLQRARKESVRLLRVVVVDNASSDGSHEGLEPSQLPLTVIRNRENRGFGAACNQGAAGSEADLLLFLNPDAEVYEDTLERAAAYLAPPERAEVGILGVALEDERGRVARSCARFPSARSFLAAAVGLDRLLPRLGLGYRMTEWDHAETRAVDHVMGAFFLVRRAVFTALAGFDEAYFLYFEDLDFSKRAADRGVATHFLAEARAFHLSGGTSRRIPARRLAYSLESKLCYARAHLSGWRSLVAQAALLVVEPGFRCAGALCSLSPAKLVATVRAYRMLALGIARER